MEINKNVIFVDCFNTIILRKNSHNEIFASWAHKVSDKYNIPWKAFYKTYKRTACNMSLKKTFAKRTLIESFDNVLDRVYKLLSKKYKDIDKETFIDDAKNFYSECEMQSHYPNKELVEVLRSEKEKGKKIYLVSDFYCESKTIRTWLENIGVLDIFDDVFSSCDYDKEKATKKLYKYLIKKLNVSPKDVVMIGDSGWSDVFMAKRAGLTAIKIKRRKERENEK